MNKRLKILLVNPEVPNTFWSFKNAVKFVSKRALLPPLGLATVAAMLPAHWEKKVVDMNAARLRNSHLKWADYVFITAMAIQRSSVQRLIDRCKRLNVKTVAGGPLFTAFPEAWPNIDHLILNEAETTLPAFLEDLKNGCPKPLYTSGEKPSLKNSPIPQWDLIDMKQYAMMSIQYSRGCPFNCDFCDVTTLFGHTLRTKTKEQIIAELNSLYAAGWREGVFFVDDNFIGNRNILKKETLPAIVQWMEEKSYPFCLNTQASINLADDEELMTLMVRAGFDCVFIGIESPDDASLSECGKIQNTGRDLVAAIKKIQQFGMQVQAGFILGFDNDRPPVFDRLIKLIQESGVVTAMVGLLNAPAGTKLYQRLKKENRITKNFTGNNTDCSLNFIPKMNYDTLMNGYKSILNTIYSPKGYYERVSNFLDEYKPRAGRVVGLQLDHIKAFVRVMWILGFKENGRSHYWRFLVKTIFKRPRFFTLSITMAIYGFHFRKVVEQYTKAPIGTHA
jgi:radical SAM superfamily enzyme YgiQ (UPF0313 family)